MERLVLSVATAAVVVFLDEAAAVAATCATVGREVLEVDTDLLPVEARPGP